MSNRGLIKGSLFLAIVISGLFSFTTKTHANTKVESLILQEEQDDETHKIEIYDIEAMQGLLEEMVMNDPLYQLNNKSIEEVRNDIQNATITYQGLDMNQLGPQDIVVMIKFDLTSRFSNMRVDTIKKNLRIEFVDTTAPIIKLSTKDAWVNSGVEFDVYSYIVSITDNSLQKITEVEVSGKVDTSTEGVYEILLSAKDSSGNIAEESLKVHVVNFLSRTRTASTTANMDDFEIFLSLINAERAALGIDPLILGDSAALDAASLRAVETTEYLSHNRPDGTRYNTALDQYGVSYVHASEVLTNAGSTVFSKFNWWMGSSNHKAILLNPKYTHIAIGVCGKMWAALLYSQ